MEKALTEHGGNVEAAIAALVRRAIPDAMALLDECRRGGRYDVIAHPWVPDMLRKQTARCSDQIWEARPKWRRPVLPPGRHEVTVEYVKAMYAKFVSTMGESNYNRELYRPDWMHLIRSQAFANLWMKAYRAHEQGLMVVRAMGTDELHVTGDWRRVFPEGRGVSDVKVKDVYTLGDDESSGSVAEEAPRAPRAQRAPMSEYTHEFGKFGARGIRGSEAMARQLDALAGGIVSPEVVRRPGRAGCG